MGVSIQVRKKSDRNSNLETSSNDNLVISRFFRYSIKDEAGIGLIYELICYDHKISEELRKIGTLYLYLIGTGERARIFISLSEKTDENGNKYLDFSFRGPIDRYLNLENKIVLESLRKKIYELCTKEALGDLEKISLKLLYKNNRLVCEHTNEKHKQDIYELVTYIGCALKSKELSELIYEKLNPNNCKEITKPSSSERKTVKNNFINYFV